MTVVEEDKLLELKKGSQTEFDPRDPENWRVANAEEISKLLGFQNTPEFRDELNQLINNPVFITSAQKGSDPQMAAKIWFSAVPPTMPRR